ncbi:toprim domain-containing protein [Roseimicrobium sp. ORNL1]|uniref:bifunctional DNA primase/helicase n=1 Tax=Roseimicrobium sp. ORNL1 TaxID=2711231 RepID=UPI0013E1B8C4|nr:toprim domain-containing protein [Roseimicrobium sp. ORNL1]QIF03715.1 hypothetical protein G5S37_20050 [Roseimicrobium sp. ORNL1]
MHLSVSEISKRLADRAEEVCRLLLPGGKAVKQHWHAGDLSGAAGDSLKVHLTGDHAGRWVDWANQQDRGDLVDLWRMARGLTAAEAIRQAKEFLGIYEPVFREKKVYRAAPDDEAAGVKPLDEQGKAMQYLVHQRKLEPAIINRYRVTGCVASRAIVFPCYSPEDQLINRSYRSLPQEHESKRVWQDKECAPCLFGWHALSRSAYQTRTVLLCEGQIDCMTWAMWGINALSIPNGSGGTWLEYELDNLAPFDNIYISFDMDGAGRRIAEQTIARLGKHRCLTVHLPEKDANDCLRAGYSEHDAREWLECATLPRVEGLVLVHELEERLITEMTPKPEPFTLPFFRGEWPHTGLYFRPGEVTTWTGVSGNGKSTFLRFLTMNAVFSRVTSMVVSLEVRVERELAKMLAMSVPPEAPLVEVRTITAFLRQVGADLMFADTLGYIKRERLLEMMWFAFQRHGAMHFVIDSLMRIEGLEENYPEQGKFLNDLQEFTKASGSHVHLVAHPRKLADGARLTKHDVKGSSLLVNNTDNLVSITRNAEKAALIRNRAPRSEWEDLHDTEIAVEKQRDSGWEDSFYLKFDPRRYTFTLCDAPGYTPKTGAGAKSGAKPRKSYTPYND